MWVFHGHFFSKAHHLHNERSRLASAAELFWQVYREELSTWIGPEL